MAFIKVFWVIDMENKKYNKIEYNNAYNKEKYDRITIMMPKGKKERIKSRADELGKSVSGYINDVLDKDIREKTDG